MSRVLNLALDRARVQTECDSLKVGVSVLEPLASGGVRLVCSSASGADRMRTKLKKHLIGTEVERERYRPRTPLW